MTNIRIKKIQQVTNSLPIIMESKKPKAHSAVLILQNPVLLWPIKECHPLEGSKSTFPSNFEQQQYLPPDDIGKL